MRLLFMRPKKGNELTVQVDEEFNQIRFKIDDGEMDMSVFVNPKDAIAIANFILSQVGN